MRPRPDLAASGRRITTHESRGAIAEAYRAGRTLTEIAASTGVSRKTVRGVLRDMGVEMRPACRRPT